MGGKKYNYEKGDKIANCIYLEPCPKKKSNHQRALFKCHCGNIFEAQIAAVKNKYIEGCKCGKFKRKNITHGLSKERAYRIYIDIKTRCFNRKSRPYKYYGWRGITMYKSWINNFELFFDYVRTLKNYDKPNYSIDRINNDGNYEPGNLRWATPKQQMNNTRRNILKLETMMESQVEKYIAKALIEESKGDKEFVTETELAYRVTGMMYADKIKSDGPISTRSIKGKMGRVRTMCEENSKLLLASVENLPDKEVTIWSWKIATMDDLELISNKYLDNSKSAKETPSKAKPEPAASESEKDEE